MTTLTGGRVLTTDRLIQRDLHFAGSTLVSKPSVGPDLDISGMIVSPGLVDIQINGGWGKDFSADPGSIWEVGEHLPQTGVTTFVPTIVTSPPDVYNEAISVMKAGPPAAYTGAHAHGWHFEGPWLSPAWKGAHDPSHLRDPDPSVAERWADSGVVTTVTIAPELERASEAAEILAAAGVLVSAGHTGADYATGRAALDRQWNAVTHLFNQMTPFHHRDAGMVGAALTSDAPCGLIVDGIHIEPGALQLAWTVLGPDRITLITDAMAAAGLGPGTYRLGEVRVVVDATGPRLGDGRLAGSDLTMDRAVANLAAMTSATVEDALLAATRTPARVTGMTDRGVLGQGLRADITVLSPDLVVELTIVDGEIVYHRAAD